MKSTRIVLLGALTLGAAACANVWGFQDFQLGPTVDASVGVVDTPDATVSVDAADDPGSLDDADAAIEAEGSSVGDGAADAGDARSAIDAADAGADAGNASCASGMTLCGSGCTNLTNDQYNCGTCDAACPGSDVHCVASMCVCAVGYHDCMGICKISTAIDSCGQSCSLCRTPINGLNNACTDAGCGTCSSTTTLCNHDTDTAACVDVRVDTSHCGACTTVCRAPDGGGTATCIGSTCGMACNTGLSACPTVKPTACVDKTSDIRNCGACGSVCPTHDSGLASTCEAGICH